MVGLYNGWPETGYAFERVHPGSVVHDRGRTCAVGRRQPARRQAACHRAGRRSGLLAQPGQARPHDQTRRHDPAGRCQRRRQPIQELEDALSSRRCLAGGDRTQRRKAASRRALHDGRKAVDRLVRGHQELAPRGLSDAAEHRGRRGRGAHGPDLAMERHGRAGEGLHRQEVPHAAGPLEVQAYRRLGD